MKTRCPLGYFRVWLTHNPKQEQRACLVYQFFWALITTRIRSK
jgi:hypothetical protein